MLSKAHLPRPRGAWRCGPARPCRWGLAPSRSASRAHVPPPAVVCRAGAHTIVSRGHAQGTLARPATHWQPRSAHLDVAVASSAVQRVRHRRFVFLRKEKRSELVAMAGLARQLRAAATDHEDVDLAGYGQVASVHATSARAPGYLRGWTQVCSPAGALRRVALTERARGRRRRLQSCLRRPSRTRSFDRT